MSSETSCVCCHQWLPLSKVVDRVCLDCRKLIKIGKLVKDRLASGKGDPFLTPAEKTHLSYLWLLVEKELV